MSVFAPPCLLSAESLGAHQVNVLVVTWQHPFTREISAIGLLAKTLSGVYSFNYVHNVLSIEDFRPLVGFPDLYARYDADDLFPLFAQRVMTPRRPDYSSFVSALGLSDVPTPWEQLPHSGGRRAGHTLQLLPVPTQAEGILGTWEVSFLVHGMRHIAGERRTLHAREVTVSQELQEHALRSLRPGDELRLLTEPQNPVNTQAILVADATGIPLGYMPDFLTEDLTLLGLENLSCTAEAVNGPNVPWHMRLSAKLSCNAPAGFQFFTSSSWQLLVSS
ncbi:hypothetical protein [Glutamicibacter sp. NPDC087344]|uniref:hypothetical protein n=1 Tax=Glutamicibacter sp. NPDC087344 TaxID=3363994 RepID=UPI003821D8A2